MTNNSIRLQVANPPWQAFTLEVRADAENGGEGAGSLPLEPR
jgi:hypothetical protein